jgi:hypothetical protein
MTTGRGLTDGQVRRIAAEWHDGQSSALYALTSTGAVRWDAGREVDTLLARGMATGPRRDLEALRAYLEEVEAEATDELGADDDLPEFLRGPLAAWVRAWDETPVVA